LDNLDGDGYALADISLDVGQCEYLASSLPSLIAAGRGGIRNLISHPTIISLLHHNRLGSYLWSVVGRDLVAVEATLLDKTAASDVHERWHQDRFIAVKERLDVTGYSSWKMKGGVLHVEPPARVLSQMLAVRIHLDDGALRVVPGTHRLGKLSEGELSDAVASSPHAELLAPQGRMLLMRPLLIHSSAATSTASHRRVLHIELAPPEAISPLHWHTAVSLRRAA
jgi:ectoine hydroxylase-related dioxygenase (phytanoyl-CoA dioxygenase family)